MFSIYSYLFKFVTVLVCALYCPLRFKIKYLGCYWLLLVFMLVLLCLTVGVLLICALVNVFDGYFVV